MADRSSIFQDEWRKCLKEHYKYVIRQQDKGTEETLVPVLHRIGFTDDELRALYREATLRTEDMPDDFVPDMERATPADAPESAASEASFAPHPAECTCPACMDTVLEEGHDEEGQPLDTPPEPDEAQGTVFPAAKTEADKADEEPSPRQQSLF